MPLDHNIKVVKSIEQVSLILDVGMDANTINVIQKSSKLKGIEAIHHQDKIVKLENRAQSLYKQAHQLYCTGGSGSTVNFTEQGRVRMRTSTFLSNMLGIVTQSDLNENENKCAVDNQQNDEHP